MSYKVAAALLAGVGLESLDGNSTDTEIDHVEVMIENADAPSDVITHANELTELASSAAALRKLAVNSVEVPDGAIAEATAQAISQTVPIGNLSLESTSANLKEILRRIWEIIKQFFKALARSFGLFQSQLAHVLRKLAQFQASLERRRHAEGPIQLIMVISSGDSRWFMKPSMTAIGVDTDLHPDASINSLAKIWTKERERVVPNLISTVKEGIRAKSDDEVELAAKRLIFAADDFNVRVAINGGGKILKHRSGLGYHLGEGVVTPEVNDTEIRISLDRLIEVIKSLVGTGKLLIELAQTSAREADELESQLKTLEHKAEITESQYPAGLAERVKVCSARMFVIDRTVIAAYIGISKAYMHSVK